MEIDIDYASHLDRRLPLRAWMKIRLPWPVRFILDEKLSWRSGGDEPWLADLAERSPDRSRWAHPGRKVQVYALLHRPARPNSPGRHYRVLIRGKFSRLRWTVRRMTVVPWLT